MSTENRSNFIAPSIQEKLNKTDEGREAIQKVEIAWLEADSYSKKSAIHDKKTLLSFGIGMIAGAIMPGVQLIFLPEFTRQFILSRLDSHKAYKATEKTEIETEKILNLLSDEEIIEIDSKLRQPQVKS